MIDVQESGEKIMLLYGAGDNLKFNQPDLATGIYELTLSKLNALGTFIVKATDEDHAIARLKMRLASEDPGVIPSMTDMECREESDLIPYYQAILQPDEDFPLVSLISNGRAVALESIMGDHDIILSPSNMSSK